MRSGTILAVQCPKCGFPNLEGTPSCIACHDALPDSVAVDNDEVTFRMGMGQAPPVVEPAPVAPVAPPVAQAVPQAVPQAAPGVAANPEGLPPSRNPQESIEMFFPERKGEMPLVAGVNPDYASDQGMQQPPSGWTSEHAIHPMGVGTESGAIADPWLTASDRPQTLGTTQPMAHRSYVPPRPVGDSRRFAPTDAITVVGIAGLLVSLILPWAERIPASGEGEVVSAADLPISFIFTGVKASYPLPWFTVFLVLAATGLTAAIASVASNRSSSYLFTSAAGIVALLVPAAVLVKLASLQEEAEVGTTFTHGAGIYLAIGAAIVMLVGATARSNRLKTDS